MRATIRLSGWFIFVLLAITLVGCGPSQELVLQSLPVEAQHLMAKYDFHPSAAPEVTRSRIATDQLSFSPYAGASGAIGLNLRSHLGETATWYSVPLAEHTRGDAGRARAVFIVVDGQVVGAGLYFEGEAPGVHALSDQTNIVR